MRIITSYNHCLTYKSCSYVVIKKHMHVQDNPVSSDNGNTMNPVRERDKSYKRKSYLNRSSNIEAVPSDRLINRKLISRIRNVILYLTLTEIVFNIVGYL